MAEEQEQKKPVMVVRAKFRCNKVTKYLDGYKTVSYNYEFSAVTSGSKENEQFWRYTPNGSINIGSIREDLFVIGQEYYLDFIPAEAQE